ncbi:MAG: ABC transporter ATP-binding protein/permease [Myxococcota bacterium]|nr:ABC transporter ATP-binding protein/permease [Myxococcota bacterium]
MGSYRRLLRYAKPYTPQLALAAAASVFAALATAFYAYLSGPLLSGLLGGNAERFGPLSLGSGDLAVKIPLLLVAVAAVKAVSQWLHGGLTNTVGQSVMTDVRRDLHSHLLELPPSFFETRHSGELLSRFSSDVGQVEFTVSQALGAYVKDGLQILALAGVCLALDPWLFLLIFIVLPGSAYPVARFARSARKEAKRTQASMGQLTEQGSELLHNLTVVQAYNATPRLAASFEAEQDRYLAAMRRSLFIRGAFSPTVELLGIIGAALAIAVGARAVEGDPELAPKLLSFLAAALLLYQPMKTISGTFAQVVQGVAASQRVFEILDAPRPPDTGAPAGPLRGAVELRDVKLSYDGARQVLQGLTLTIPAGQRVALVGASGAGKSTVFSLLLGFIQAQEGKVLWDGEALDSLSRSSLRERVAWVPQEPILFSGTVRHNLLLGDVDATEDRLWEALRRAHAEAFVRALPLGLEQPVGERGGLLSGGQRQRLAIARAFLKEPSLLLLDEPTSALDAASEQEVQAGLRELMEGRTTLVIAHRLRTVRDAALIHVLSEGRLVESGTHQSLLAARGVYASLLQQGQLRVTPEG